jgi:copper transport protein
MRLVAGLVTLLSVLSIASGAFAHASLVSVTPADGSVLARPPATVQLRFNEPVTLTDIRLIDAEGRTRDDIKVIARNEIVELVLPDGLPRGTELVSYRVVSADGHPVGGSMVFSIGMRTVTSGPQTLTSPWLGSLIWLARLGVYVGLFAGIGGTFFRAWIDSSHGTHLTAAALVVGLIACLASLGLQGLDLRNASLGDFFTAAPWKAAAGTSLLASSIVALIAMAAAFAARWSTSTRAGAALSAVAIAGVGVSLAASGHAATASPQWLTRPLVFLHGAGAAFWVGALAPLTAMAWRAEPGLLSALNRFSRAAILVVGVLVLTGLGLAVIQLASIRALIETRYGLVLSIKLMLVAILLGLAAINRFRLTPALAADPHETRPLARSILAECVLAVAILAVVAGWRFTPPPRTLVASARPQLAVHVHASQGMLEVKVSPGVAGTDDFSIELMDSEGVPLVAKEATVILSLPERGIEPLERAATLGADGGWQVRDVPLAYPGRWHLRFEALVTDFSKIALEGDIDVPAP